MAESKINVRIVAVHVAAAVIFCPVDDELAHAGADEHVVGALRRLKLGLVAHARPDEAGVLKDVAERRNQRVHCQVDTALHLADLRRGHVEQVVLADSQRRFDVAQDWVRAVLDGLPRHVLLLLPSVRSG